MGKCYLISKDLCWSQNDGKDGREEICRSINRNVKNSKYYIWMNE